MALSLIIAFFVYRDGRAARSASVDDDRALRRPAREEPDRSGRRHHARRHLRHSRHGAGAGRAGRAGLLCGRRSRRVFPRPADIFPLPSSRWDRPGMASRPASGSSSTGDYLVGRGLFLYGVGVISLIDNFLKPYFISREGKLPFLLVFLGVLGGVLGVWLHRHLSGAGAAGHRIQSGQGVEQRQSRGLGGGPGHPGFCGPLAPYCLAVSGARRQWQQRGDGI